MIDIMTRKKILLIVTVTGLSIVNVYLARFIFQPAEVISPIITEAEIKLPKAPDILVMDVADIHPITHLQEAARIRNDLVPVSRAPPRLPVIGMDGGSRPVVQSSKDRFSAAKDLDNLKPSLNSIRPTNNVEDQPKVHNPSIPKALDLGAILHKQSNTKVTSNKDDFNSADTLNTFNPRGENNQIGLSKNYEEAYDDVQANIGERPTVDYVSAANNANYDKQADLLVPSSNSLPKLHGDKIPSDISGPGIFDSLGSRQNSLEGEASHRDNQEIYKQNSYGQIEEGNHRDQQQRNPVQESPTLFDQIHRTLQLPDEPRNVDEQPLHPSQEEQEQQNPMNPQNMSPLNSPDFQLSAKNSALFLDEMRQNIASENFVEGGSVDEKFLKELFQKAKSGHILNDSNAEF